MKISRSIAYPSKRTAPARPLASKLMSSEAITWTRILDVSGAAPIEIYQILYCDRFGEVTERTIELRKIGKQAGAAYLGVMDQGKFKSLRLDRIRGVFQISTGHETSIRTLPTYNSVLPSFPLPAAIHKVPTVAVSKRTWTVDLNAYTCTCPEKRERAARGYSPGQLGAICPHLARAIVAYLPKDAGWQPELLEFLTDPRSVHLDNLV